MAKVLNGWKSIASFFSVTVRTLRDWNKISPIPVSKISNQVFITEKDLLSWLHTFRVENYLFETGAVKEPPEYKNKKG